MERVGIYMDLKRFFSDNIDCEKKTAVLTGEEFYHAVKVTRHKKGFKLIVNGKGEFDYLCTVAEINSNELVAVIDKIISNPSETKNPLTLYVGVNKDLDTVVQKAVELGAQKIVPFTSAHSNIDKINRARLEKIVLESSKQCGRAFLAEISDLMTINEAINVSIDTNMLVFYEHERTNKVADCKVNEIKETSVFIGSEGGFSCSEIELFKANGANILTLGKRILRVSTAVCAALSLVLERLGEM